MLRLLFLIFVILVKIRADDICERPKQLIDNESKCLGLTMTFFERVTYRATEAINIAKTKLGVEFDEEPLKCGYYLCILHNIEMVNEAGILDPSSIQKWITQHIAKNMLDEFTHYVTECLESINTDQTAEKTNCEKTQHFTKCLSQYQRCPIFKFP